MVLVLVCTYSLLLSPRYHDAPLPHTGVILMSEPHDEVVGVALLRGRDDVIVDVALRY